MRASSLIEGVARVAERCNNLLGSLALPLPPRTHVDGLRPNIQEMRDELRRIVVGVKGEDPWEGHPGWE